MLVGLALGLVGVLILVRSLDRSAPSPMPSALPPGGLPTFSLRHQGGVFGNGELQGHWTLMTFGYTQCPDICPTTLSLLKSLREQWERDGIEFPQVVLVSVDPGRDPPSMLARYVAAFDPAFLGITGDEAQLQQLARGLGAAYRRYDGQDPRHYSVDHSTDLYLIDPAGRLRSRFPQPLAPEALAREIRSLIGASAVPRTAVSAM
ncbi:SCO family protein [Denitratisoma oestradiolicum]|nr:hypothetical protein CBW56_03040 [Denitratisoma oestradiolicum]